MSSRPQQIVSIGASSGGLDALRPLLERFSYDHAAFVIVTHLSPGWKSILANLLQRHTILEMQKVTHSTSMRTNHAYVLGEGVEISCEGDTIHCHEREEGSLSRPIDRFFSSLARSWQHRALGVILSGAGSDGAVGLRTLREHGARTFVQAPSTALFSSMPKSAEPFADVCLEPRALGDEIMRSLNGFQSQDEVLQGE